MKILIEISKEEINALEAMIYEEQSEEEFVKNQKIAGKVFSKICEQVGLSRNNALIPILAKTFKREIERLKRGGLVE